MTINNNAIINTLLMIYNIEQKCKVLCIWIYFKMHTSIRGRQVRLGLWGFTFQAAGQVMMYSACLYCVYACVYMFSVTHIKFIHRNDYTHVV